MSDFDKEKNQIIDDIKALHSKMSEIILYNNIKPSVWEEVVSGLIAKRMSHLCLIHKSLSELHDGIYTEMHKVWTQPNMTSEMWHNYKLFFDKPQLIEQKQMFQLRQKLRIFWSRFREDIGRLRMKQKDNDGTSQDTKQTETGTHDQGSTD